MKAYCKHEYHLETVGGVYLTGAYVCQLCSYRVSMSHEQFHQHATYPRLYQTPEDTAERESGEEEVGTQEREHSHPSADRQKTR